MSLFICPICKEPLFLQERSYRCVNNHCFDLAKENYVNLLPVNQKNSKNPGDDKNMVNSRFAFLNKNYYASLRKALCDLSVKYTDNSCAVLDCGCGEGYYTNEIYSKLIENKKLAQMCGIDISKWATRLASKKSTGVNYAVASAYKLPIKSDSMDLLINCFSPLCLEEFQRVLKKDAVFLYVVPAGKHLIELKSAVYDNPYENEEKTEIYDNFSHVEKFCVEQKIFIDNNEDIKNLFMMTPYAWKTSKEALLKLDDINSLEITVAFHIHVYKKDV